MYRGSRSSVRSRGIRSRGGYHAHSHRDANTHFQHFSRYHERSESPGYQPNRRPRPRSRSPSVEEVHMPREHRRPRHWSREDDRPPRHRRSVSPIQTRERSRSPVGFTSRGRREARERDRVRSRSIEHNWDGREDTRDARRHRQESREEDHEDKQEFKRAHPSSSNGKPFKNDRFHWRKDANKDGLPEGNQQDEDTRSDGVHDLREIIKRSRELTHSPHRDFEGNENSQESEQYFKEFVPNVAKRNTSSRWHDVTKHEEIISFKKSIHNNIASDEGQFVSSKDSHPDIPYFDGTDQDLTPRQFVKQIEDLGYANAWNSNELKCQMAAKLMGAAREWFLKDELMNEPWEKVKVQFIKMHPTDMDYYQQLRKMMDRTMFDNESYSNYFTFKTMLMSAVGISGRKAVSCLIGGMGNPELETQCYQRNFATPELLFEYLSAKKDSDQQKALEKTSRKSSHTHSQRADSAKHDTHQHQLGHKKPLLKTPPSMNNAHREGHAHGMPEFTNEPFVISKPDYETRHLLTIKMKNHLLDAYNDLTAQCVTIKEESAKHIHMDYSRRRTTIIGSRGVPVMALGDCDARIGVDQATVIVKVYIVPNICQEKPVVVGKSLREHQHLSYHESPSCVTFKQKAYPSSFATNEKRKEKSNHIK